MGRLWNKWLVPALFAVILFLCIRVANDIPKHEYYWESNEWNFMLKDMLVVLFMSYPIFFLLKYWLRLCRKRMTHIVRRHQTGTVRTTTPYSCHHTNFRFRHKRVLGIAFAWRFQKGSETKESRRKKEIDETKRVNL